MEIGLRERKKSQKKVEVFHIFTEKIRAGESFKEISIKEVCEKAELSEASFYNYFPHKSDLFHFMINLWQMTIINEAELKTSEAKGMEFIEGLFLQIVSYMSSTNELMLSMGAKENREVSSNFCVTDYEITLAYPDSCVQILALKHRKIIDAIQEHLGIALSSGEIPKTANPKMVGLSLISILFGGAIAARGAAPGLNKELIKFNLEVFLKGIQQA